VTILSNYHFGHIVLGSMCVGVSVWLGWSGMCVAGFGLNLLAPNVNYSGQAVGPLNSRTCEPFK